MRVLPTVSQSNRGRIVVWQPLADDTVLPDLLIPAQPGTKLTSCFIEASFTIALRLQ